MHPSPKYITFVCTGNTCRSPMAERLFLHAIKAEPEPLASLHAISAGILAIDGAEPSIHSKQALKSCGINLDNHKSRQLTQAIIDNSLLLVCMTSSHQSFILSHFSLNSTPVILLRQFLPNNPSPDVFDPFGQGLSEYQSCRDSIVEAIPSLIHYIKQTLFS